MRRWRALVTMAAGVALASTSLVACGGGDVGTASRFDVEFRELARGDVRITSPSAVGAGLVSFHLRNNGASPHQAQLFRVVGDPSRAEVLAAIRALARGAPIPRWIRDGGGATVPPRRSVTVAQRLKEGDWYLADTERPRATGDTRPFYERGGLVAFTVTSGGRRAELPAAHGTVTARDYEFQVRGLEPGTQRIRFQNRGRQLHHLVAARLPAGRTFEEVRKYLADPSATISPPVSFSDGVTLAAIDRGTAMVAEVPLRRGTYVIACFLHDRSGGPSHASRGMVQELRVGR